MTNRPTLDIRPLVCKSPPLAAGIAVKNSRFFPRFRSLLGAASRGEKMPEFFTAPQPPKRERLARGFVFSRLVCGICAAIAAAVPSSGRAAGFAVDTLAVDTFSVAVEEKSSPAELLRRLPADVFTGDQGPQARAKLREHLRERLQAANDQSRAEWLKIETRDQWEAFRRQRLDALRRSLMADWPPAPKTVQPRITSKIDGDGYMIENIVLESRPGWFVTANLYRPAEPPAAMPGIIISHSHHSPKTQGELQDMGATWARAGCVVLVPDHMGHGERGQHGFKTERDFPREFRPSRQDYYFRFDSSLQLYLVGDSLMGWMVWDLMRGVDVLLAQRGIDKDKIIMLGGVAGGGDPCGVAAALDERIACAVPFNFGGPQPETRFPLPDDAETWFNYAGSGSWESTRNLAFSAARTSRFLHWEIVGSVAPRRLIHAHEFAWDGERDPVWRRYQRVYKLYDRPDHLAVAHGKGLLRQSAPQASHCGNIGAFHRQMIHPAFEKWFGIRATEFSRRRDAADLAAMTPEIAAELRPKVLHELLAPRAAASLALARERRAELSPPQRRAHLRRAMAQVLGDVEPPAIKESRPSNKKMDEAAPGVLLRRVVMSDIPLLLLTPDGEADKPRPVVVGLAHGGKKGFLQHRSEEIARLLAAGVAVCLPDVSDTGETAADDSRGQFSGSTSRAATALMLGDPLAAQQLRDVRLVLSWLRKQEGVDGQRIALWGESFAPLNDADTNFRVPRRISGRPHDAEPLGGMLALVAALFEDGIAAVHVHRGLASFESVLESPFVYVPLDSVVPGMLQHGDLPDIAAALAPLPLNLSGAADAHNRALEPEKAREIYKPARESYAAASAADALSIKAAEADAAAWLIETLTSR